MAFLLNPTELYTRHMVIRLILDDSVFPSEQNSNSAEPANIKTIIVKSDNKSLTVDVNINKSSGFMQCSADITIYGMTKEDCNAFARFSPPTQLQFLKNHVEIYAGYNVDKNGFPPLAWAGQCYIAAPDYNDPSRPLKIQGLIGLVDQNTMSPTSNPPGTILLDSLFKSIVAKAPKAPQKYTYFGNNVSGVVDNAVYSGSWIEQLSSAAADYGYQARVDGYDVFVTPQGQPYDNSTYILTPTNGLLGYPQIDQYGITVRCRYNPQIQFGQKIKIQDSEFTLANGEWFINGMVHTLQNRGDKWETTLTLNQIQFNIPGASVA